MTDRIAERHLAEHDRFYAELLAAHSGLDDDQSASLNARLVLIMANYVGDLEVLRDMLALAEKTSGSR